MLKKECHFFVKYNAAIFDYFNSIQTVKKQDAPIIRKEHILKNTKISELNINNELFIQCHVTDNFVYYEMYHHDFLVERTSSTSIEEDLFLNYTERVILSILRNDYEGLCSFSPSFIDNLFIYYKSKFRNTHSMYLFEGESFFLIFSPTINNHEEIHILCIDKRKLREELDTFLLYFLHKIFYTKIMFNEKNIHEIFEELIHLIEKNNDYNEHQQQVFENDLDKVLLQLI